MFPQPMSRPEFRPDDSHLDLTRTLEQHILAGLSPDLALDLVLNEIVVRAAQATRASAAALALARGDEMVCRAATGHLAPDLGVPLNSRDGLSGACLQTRQPQLSVDTEFDPRVAPAVPPHLGIRPILIVPVFDTNDDNLQFTGVLEVFSTSPAAFSHFDQKLLEGFAEECSRIRHAAIELAQRPPAPPELVPPELVPLELIPTPEFIAASPLPARRPYEAWTLVLGSLVVLATIAVSFLIGYRIGWLRPTASRAQISQPIPAATSVPRPPAKSAAAAHRANPSPSEKSSAKASAKASAQASPTPAADDLVVYEKGKIIFRMKPDSTKPDRAKDNQAKPDSTKRDSDSIVEASSTTKIAPAQSVWLPPAQAATRLLSRTEPRYPPDALADHHTGNVVLEVPVAKAGPDSNVRTLSGAPLLAPAATEAVRNWRYQPYRLHDHPSQFQTDVTLSFSLTN